VGNRVFDQRLKDCSIHIGKLFDVEASLACGVFAEFRQEGSSLAVPQHAVQDKGNLAR